MKSVPLMTRKSFASGNPGDVFICLGLQYLISKTTKEPIEYFYLDKFSPMDFAQNTQILKDAGRLIYAGTPQYNNYDDWCLWYDWAVWQQYIIPLGLEFHTIAGGAGFPDPKMTPEEFASYCLKSDKTKSILRQKMDRTGLTIVRDAHSYRLLERMGKAPLLLPCTATWAPKYLGVTKAKKGTYLGLVLPGTSILRPELLGVKTEHEVRQTLIRKWKELYEATKEKNPLFICHGEEEYRLVREEGLPAFYTNDVLALMRMYANCHGVISSRLHACLPAVGLGIKNIVSIPIDTRGAATRLLGLPEVSIADFEVETILECFLQEVDCADELKESEQIYLESLGGII